MATEAVGLEIGGLFISHEHGRFDTQRRRDSSTEIYRELSVK